MGRATHPPAPAASNTHALLAVNLEAGRCGVKQLRDGIVTVLFLRQNPNLPVMTLHPGPSRQGNYNNRRGWAGCVERKGRQLAKVNQQPAAHHLLNLLLCGVNPQAAGFTERKDMLFFCILFGCDTRWVLFLLWKLFGIT
jgi:hypothetical protein